MAENDEQLDALYFEGLQWWQSYCAVLTRLKEERANSRRFLSDFGHVVARAAVAAPDEMAGHATPPPLPGQGPDYDVPQVNEDAEDRAFEERIHNLRQRHGGRR